MVKYDPTRAAREVAADPVDPVIRHSDPVFDVAWGDPATALRSPWVHSHLMRGAGSGIPKMQIGDLLFVMRTDRLPTDPGRLTRRSLIGLWWFESRLDYFEMWQGRPHWYREARTFPLRRFDFPVPIEAVGDIDSSFAAVAAFHDESRSAFIGLDAPEALAVMRACGLPAEVLTEPDPDNLAPLVRDLDLGPPTDVRRRILDGARCSAHRRSVETAAVDLVVKQLERARFAVDRTEHIKGLGSDLHARAASVDGHLADVRIEVKGLSGADPWAAHLTRAELAAAKADVASGSGEWWLVIVTRALREDRKQWWLNSAETIDVFTIDHGATATADRSRARALAAG